MGGLLASQMDVGDVSAIRSRSAPTGRPRRADTSHS